ncbi:hypothetical protein BJ684DRAFT_19266 [Piptocephalis cylindrospora]|uniref:DH domain-containing protein n=1 Tax=Piptocephalis cylindrospora TaxID=1907219 RepID=A0A4P9Y5M4_9FUNG|nr:hypothetical protein BJ684DRAFT_19266 [Piptocephalis cylindrospora]|eukprot:RKP14316.1 hypothetical protein BJ684DRAFT_19266 [Piptocephalis cylindrospora]
MLGLSNLPCHGTNDAASDHDVHDASMGSPTSVSHPIHESTGHERAEEENDIPAWQKIYSRIHHLERAYEAHCQDMCKVWLPCIQQLMSPKPPCSEAMLIPSFLRLTQASLKSLEKVCSPDTLLRWAVERLEKMELGCTEYLQGYAGLHATLDYIGKQGVQVGKYSLIEWSQCPLQHLKALNETLETVRPHPMMHESMAQLDKILSLEVEASRCVMEWSDLRVLEESIDCSNVKEFSDGPVKRPVTMTLADPGSVTCRRFVAEESFECIDYRKSLGPKSARRPMILLLLTDQLLLCAPVPPTTFTSAHIQISEASTTLIKHEWSGGASSDQEVVNGGSTTSQKEGLDKAASVITMTINGNSSISGVSKLTTLTGMVSGAGNMIVKAQTRAIQPPVSLEGTERVCKVRRCKTWMMRHNIEGELRWMRDDLATFELRRAPCSPSEKDEDEMNDEDDSDKGVTTRRRGRPFLLIYEERPSPWDDRENPATVAVWLLPETQLERTGPTRLFIHNRYCVEFPSRKEATACLRLLDAERARLASTGPANIIAITGTLLSIGRVNAYIRGPKGNWEELGVCQAEFQSTTTQCAAFSLAMAGSSRTCFQAWVHPDTSIKRIDPRNLIAVLPAPDSSARAILLRSREPQESTALEELFVAAKHDSTFKASDSFISCYGPGYEHEEEIFDEIAKVYAKEDGKERLVGLGRLYVHLLRSDRSRRMFLVSSELHEEVLQVQLPPQFSNVIRSSLTVTVTTKEEEGENSRSVSYEIKVRSEKEARRLEGSLLSLPIVRDLPNPSGSNDSEMEEMGLGRTGIHEGDGEEEMMEKILQEEELIREEHGIVEEEMCAQMEVDMAVALEQISQLSLGSRGGVSYLAAVPEEDEGEEEEYELMKKKRELQRGLRKAPSTPEGTAGKRSAPGDEKDSEEEEIKEEEPCPAPRILRHKRSRTGEDGSAKTLRSAPVEPSGSTGSLSKSMVEMRRRLSQENLFGIIMPGENGWKGDATEKGQIRRSASPPTDNTSAKYECGPRELLQLFGLESAEDWVQAGASAEDTAMLLDPRARTRATLASLMSFIHANSTS